jgi:SpoVK/Ycf46/Vps4 family AAA+-type ATPase
MVSPFPTEKRILRVIKPAENKVNKRLIRGKEYLDILEKIVRIAHHQQLYAVNEGIKGFIFYGDVGIGKTMCAKAVASMLGAPLIFIDGADIARPLYGQSEMQISKVFEEAKKYRYAVSMIDDCESVFPTRDWAKAESWHIAQNNVFFHELDNIDTSKLLVILTTNRYDLLDKAVKDRLYNIEFPLPSKGALKEIAKFKCSQLRMDPHTVLKQIDKGLFKTVWELEKFLLELYINEVLRKK